MSEQESIQTQLDTLRYDMDELVKGRETQAENMRNLGMTLVREHTLLSRLVIQHETFVRDTCKALEALQAIVNSQHRELHLLRDTVASLQQDVDLVAVSATKLVRHITRVEKELHLLRDTVASLQKDVATLEEKFRLMEEVTNVTVSLDETDEGGAERAEMDYERQVQAEKDYARQAIRED